MTIEPRVAQYLRGVLSMEPAEQADAIVRVRSQFLAGMEFDSPQAENDHELDRAGGLQAIAKIRQQFWDHEPVALAEELARLSKSKFPEVSATASRLRRVADARHEFAQLALDESIHPAFREALRKIVVVAPAEANRLREQQFAYIRPDRNPAYEVAHQAIRHAVQHIQSKYSQVYEIEAIWFGELFHYKPYWDLPDEDADSTQGLGLLFVIFLVFGVAFLVVMKIFDLGV